MRWLKVLGILGKLQLLHDTLFFYCIRNRYEPHPKTALRLTNTYALLLAFCLCFPLFHCFFPVRYLSAGNGFRLLACLVARLVACPLCFHIGNGLLVEDNDRTTTYCIVQFLFAKGFAYSLKEKYKLLSKAKKRSHANCRFAWLLQLFCMLILHFRYSIYPFIGINIKSPIYFVTGQSAVNISLSVPEHKIVGYPSLIRNH